LTRRACVAAIVVWALTVPGVALAAAAPEPPVDAAAIVDRVDRLLRGDSSEGELSMAVVTRRWTRTVTMKVWSEGTDKALIKVTGPPKEAGTATLKARNEIWNYLPKIDRTIRVPTSMMMASWMGSHFTNDDLVKESRWVRDYDIRTDVSGVRDGVEVWHFVLTPQAAAAVVWGRAGSAREPLARRPGVLQHGWQAHRPDNFAHRTWGRVIRRAELRPIRDLRHTYANLLIAQGVHPQYIQAEPRPRVDPDDARPLRAPHAGCVRRGGTAAHRLAFGESAAPGVVVDRGAAVAEWAQRRRRG
jgi:hypothetical protein